MDGNFLTLSENLLLFSIIAVQKTYISIKVIHKSHHLFGFLKKPNKFSHTHYTGLCGDCLMTASCKRLPYPLCPSLSCVFYLPQGRSDKGLKSLTSYLTVSLAELERSKTQNKSINCSRTATVAIRDIRKKNNLFLLAERVYVCFSRLLCHFQLLTVIQEDRATKEALRT